MINNNSFQNKKRSKFDYTKNNIVKAALNIMNKHTITAVIEFNNGAETNTNINTANTTANTTINLDDSTVLLIQMY